MNWNWPPELTNTVIGLIGLILGALIPGLISLFTHRQDRKDHLQHRNEDLQHRYAEPRLADELATLKEFHASVGNVFFSLHRYSAIVTTSEVGDPRLDSSSQDVGQNVDTCFRLFLHARLYMSDDLQVTTTQFLAAAITAWGVGNWESTDDASHPTKPVTSDLAHTLQEYVDAAGDHYQRLTSGLASHLVANPTRIAATHTPQHVHKQ
jgi:hypothetical protein